MGDTFNFAALGGLTVQGATTGTTLNPHSIAWVVGSGNVIDIYVNDSASAETIGGTGSTAPDLQIHLTNANVASLTNAFILS